MVIRATLCLLLFLVAAGVRADGPAVPRLIFEAPPALEPMAAQLRDFDPERLAQAVRFVGLADPGPPIRVILAPEGSPAAGQVPSWVSGFALADRGLVVLLPSRLPAYPDTSLDDLLGHEIAHVLVGRAAGGRPLPRWFQEGMAMIAGKSWGLDERTRMTLALVRGRAVSFAELEQSFQGGEGTVGWAYAVAGAFVRDVVQKHGPQAPGAILGGVAAGLPFEQAFRRATGSSLQEAESDFWRRQTFWYRWVPVLTSSAVVWIGITLLALWAIRGRRRRDAALYARWDEEERRLAERPPPDELVN